MEYGMLVYFVLLHCSINALPYERDSHEIDEFEDEYEDIDKLLDEQQQETINLEKGNDFESLNDKICSDEKLYKEKVDVVDIESDNSKSVQEDKRKLDLEKQETLELEKKIVTDKPKPAKYEVTENVIDVPDDRTKGPIVPNFSVPRPINIVPNSTPKEDISGDKITSSGGNNPNKVVETDDKDMGAGKKNYISILHVKAEIDDKTDKTNKDRIDSGDFDFGNVPHVSGIKEYFKGIKQGIVNGFNSILHRHRSTEENHDHDVETGTFNFFNKISKKSSDIAQKIHNHIFGEPEEN